MSIMSREKALQDSMTNSRKIDPRIERTREALRGALMALIEEKGLTRFQFRISPGGHG